MNAETKPLMPQRADYEPTVKALRPGCTGEELDIRASLLLMRDRAMSVKRRSSEPGWVVLDVVEKLASDNALQPMPLDDLKEIHRLAIRLVSCASGLDAVFAPGLPLEKGKE